MAWVSIQVGDVSFSTTHTTLRAAPYFENLLHDLQTDGGTDASVLRIDRDGTHFRHILNYLRGASVLPRDPSHLEELKVEADFYCLSELFHRIENKLRQIASS